MLNLKKSYEVQLKDVVNSLKVEVKWSPSNVDVDLDLMSIVLGKDGKILNDNDDNVIFYNNPEISNKSIRLTNTDRVGGGRGEVMEFDLTKIYISVDRVDIILNNFNNKINLIDIDCTIRVYFNGSDNPALVFDRDDLLVRSDSTVLEIGSLIRQGKRWRLKVENLGHNVKLPEYLSQYGVECSSE